jgi:phosphatidylserine/phosphatidylglycerophosphate/cardiolipin synthase-like enzyme
MNRWVRLLVAVLLLGGLLVATPGHGSAQAAQAAPTWRPHTGPTFNNPLGKKKQQQAILRQVLQAVRHTHRGATISMAVYSFDRADLAYALRKARKRGVRVQIIVNKAVMSGVARKLQKRLGKNPNKPNFLVACRGACRTKGKGGNMHVKIFAFSQTGAARNVVISSSGNMTSKAIYRQWNDSYTVADDAGLYSTWQNLFQQMAHQRRTGPRRITYTSSRGYSTQFQRRLTPQAPVSSTSMERYKPSADPVVHRIRAISCQAPAGYGRKGRTVVRIAAYAMFQVRGRALAKALVKKKKQGCDIAIVMSVPGGGTYKMMQRAHIPIRSADWLFAERVAEKEDGISGWGPRFYSHHKMMMVNGVYQGRPVKAVWTGSENWSAISFANEEVVFTVVDRRVFRAYLKRWRSMYHGRATHRMGIQPTYGP